MKFLVEKIGDIWKVKDVTTGVYITIGIHSKKIADEIAFDFNAMENKDYRCLGLPDFSNPKGE